MCLAILWNWRLKGYIVDPLTLEGAVWVQTTQLVLTFIMFLRSRRDLSIVNVSQTERGNSRNTDTTKITNFDEFNDINFLLVSLNKY